MRWKRRIRYQKYRLNSCNNSAERRRTHASQWRAFISRFDYIPIPNIPLHDASIIMGLEGKGEAAEIFKAAASAVSTFGVRASPEPGLSGAERALAKIEEARLKNLTD
tara:strand:- start:220 stop:543 length:324 start_codon:yes stop_codon:yes gene_type:complete